MTKFILFNEENILCARYDSEINEQIPTEAIEVSDAVFFATINEQDGIWKLINEQVIKTAFPEPSIDQIAKQFDTAVQKELDEDAAVHGWGSINNAVAAAGKPGYFQADADLYFARWNAAWAHCFAELAKVKNGTRPMPTIKEIIAELPPRVSGPVEA